MSYILEIESWSEICRFLSENTDAIINASHFIGGAKFKELAEHTIAVVHNTSTPSWKQLRDLDLLCERLMSGGDSRSYNRTILSEELEFVRRAEIALLANELKAVLKSAAKATPSRYRF